MKSRKLLRVLQRALSALAHWAPIFGETQYLPGLVFPFVKMFQNNQLITFEFLATILCKLVGTHSGRRRDLVCPSMRFIMHITEESSLGEYTSILY